MAESTAKAKSKSKSDRSRGEKKKTTHEEFKVNGAELLEKFKQLVHEGNVRKITIIDKNGKELVRFPLTFGVIGTALAPILAAVGAIAALITECTISVEREEN